MKVTNPDFLEARRDKNLKAFVLVQRKEKNSHSELEIRTYMRLCLEYQLKYNKTSGDVFVETDSEIKIDDYSGYSGVPKRDIKQIFFHIDIVQPNSHVLTFLNAIKKDSDIKFKVVAFNGCDTYQKVNLVAHQLYGIIDGKSYFLNSYVGFDDTASPVK